MGTDALWHRRRGESSGARGADTTAKLDENARTLNLKKPEAQAGRIKEHWFRIMSIAAYLQLAVLNRKFLGFGFLMAFASSFGQTYFIGVFGPDIQAEFALSHTAWGTIYMIGTLCSAALLPWSGRQIDRLELGHYSVLVVMLLLLACAFTALVSGVVTLVVAIFLLRHSGQGLMSHVAITAMARYFDAGRGRAIALATLGFAAGEAILPFVAVLTIATMGWRWSYGGGAVLLGLVFIPTVLWLLAGHTERHRLYLARVAGAAAHDQAERRSWTSTEVLRDRRFRLLLPGLLAPAMIVTAMFFHHLSLADEKGWSHAWVTGSYVIFAAASISASLISGPLVDRLGAVRLVPYMLSPLTLAMIVVAVFDEPWAVWLYFILAGAHTGVAHTAVAAMWAEIYGVAHLGAVKSMATALGVFGSALGPVIMGALIDLSVTIEQVCLLFAAYTVLGSVLIRAALGGAADDCCAGRT